MAKYIVILVAVISYLIGSVNFSIMISKAISGKDIRESGSGNAGATNMLRTHGKKMAIITLVLDILKGVVCVLIAVLYVNYINSPARDAIWGRSDLAMYRDAINSVALPYIAGVCVILGHNFPLYFGFKGGKGVATSLGVVLLLDWRVGLILAVCCIAIMAVTRYVSLGSIIGGAAYIVIEIIKAVVTNDFNVIRMVCVVIIGGLLIARHHANIKRLLNGTENKLGAKKE
ncbi:MAG: glycerol-3-phosphate 1-O-acyltransferase PlsY [Clostridia bacterium]|nr:glycerol-3-phosphate 1-O-acyltransferase PlsY [Clostridia bacterium]